MRETYFDRIMRELREKRLARQHRPRGHREGYWREYRRAHPRLRGKNYHAPFIGVDGTDSEMQGYTPRKCLNCDAAVLNRRKLYCGERCRQIAELIRYARRKLGEGTYDRPDIAEAIIIRRSQLVMGFYDKRARRVTDKDRQELIARSNGRCERCGCDFGAEGDTRFTVQHTPTDDGLRLEAWCYRCNMNDAQSMVIVFSDEDLERYSLRRNHLSNPTLDRAWPGHPRLFSSTFALQHRRGPPDKPGEGRFF